MLALLIGDFVLDGHCETDVEPTPMAFPSSDPDEAYGPTLDWGYGQVHERNNEGLVRVTWPFPDVPDRYGNTPPEYVDPCCLHDSRCACIWSTREWYLKLGGKMWEDLKFWEKYDADYRWKWIDKDTPY